MTTTRPSAWVCGDCSMPEETKRPLRRACHHCGKVLCGECEQVFPDGAFAGPPLARGRRAVHCRACRDRHHPRLTRW
jgi:hypothetical protein